eukprot:SAG25_NODE_159_length_13431_cov_7.038629_6_plen_53_part_00
MPSKQTDERLVGGREVPPGAAVRPCCLLHGWLLLLGLALSEYGCSKGQCCST